MPRPAEWRWLLLFLCHGTEQGSGQKGTCSSLELLLPALSSPPVRLQKEVRLAQKADYSAQRVASPLPYDKISVSCCGGLGCVPHGPLLAGHSALWSAALTLPLLSLQPGDKTLAQSAQMYHYQHQKQQMLSMEK